MQPKEATAAFVPMTATVAWIKLIAWSAGWCDAAGAGDGGATGAASWMRWIASPQFETVDPRAAGLRVGAVDFHHVRPHAVAGGDHAGAAYAWLYIRTGKLRRAVIAGHAVTNGVLGIWVVWSGRWSSGDRPEAPPPSA